MKKTIALPALFALSSSLVLSWGEKENMFLDLNADLVKLEIPQKSTPDIHPELRYFLYGGRGANDIFQQTSAIMPSCLAYNILLKQSFSELINVAAFMRKDIAVRAQTAEADLFSKRRIDIPTDIAAAVTPMTMYPFMRSVMIENLSRYSVSDDFLPVDDAIEIRFRKNSADEWFKTFHLEHTDINQLGAYIHRIINGRDGSGEAGIKLLNFQNGTEDYTYIHAMQKAFKDALNTQYLPPDKQNSVQIGYAELRVRGTSIPVRSFMFPWIDGFSVSDYSNVPFLIIHPSPLALRFHMGWTEEAFEQARYATGSNTEKYKKIAEFLYRWSLTMPFVRGSAAVGEWLAGALYLIHGLTPPQAPNEIISYFDQFAHGSFSHVDFVNNYMSLVNTEE
jgi:hypothetical protein